MSVIPPLPATYVEHVVAPIGIGDLDAPQAAGEIGSMIGGQGVRFTLTYRSDGADGSLVEDVCGRAFGSAALLAPISWIASSIKGRTWADASATSVEGVLAALRGTDDAYLPAAVERATVLAVKALRRALGIAHNGNPADCEGPGILVCRCIGVGDRAIREAIRNGAGDPEAIGAACGACTGCRSCRPDLLVLIDEETREPLPVPAADRPAIERITLARGGPHLRALGLDLLDARWEAASGVVRLALADPAEGATIQPIGAIALVRHLLRETVHDDIRVEAFAG